MTGLQVGGCRCGCQICGAYRGKTWTFIRREIRREPFLLCRSCNKKSDSELSEQLREQRMSGNNPLSTLKRFIERILGE